MKKIMFTLVVLLFMTGLSFGQHGQPIQKINGNNSFFTIKQIKDFALGTTELSENYRRELCRIINKGLADAGENIQVNEQNISWIFDHMHLSKEKLGNFTNSERIGNDIVFFPDIDLSRDGWVISIFEYGRCKLKAIKNVCMNLMEILVEVSNVANSRNSVSDQRDPQYSNNNNGQYDNFREQRFQNSNNGNYYIVETPYRAERVYRSNCSTGFAGYNIEQTILPNRNYDYNYNNGTNANCHREVSVLPLPPSPPSPKEVVNFLESHNPFHH